jgi:hypothetical protein
VIRGLPKSLCPVEKKPQWDTWLLTEFTKS